MSTDIKTTHYDFDPNPRFGAKGEKRWIVRLWTSRELNGAQTAGWVAFKSYVSKANAERSAARLNAGVKTPEPVDPTVAPRWQLDALAATKGTKFGAILRCAINRNIPEAFPQFSGKATITSDGFVMCNFTDADGRFHIGAFVGSASDLSINIAGLADHLDLSREDHLALCAAITNWIEKDYRS